jgi:hypothetical protein
VASWRAAPYVSPADGRGTTSWRLGIAPASPHEEHCGGAFGATDSSAKRTRNRYVLYGVGWNWPAWRVERAQMECSGALPTVSRYVIRRGDAADVGRCGCLEERFRL